MKLLPWMVEIDQRYAELFPCGATQEDIEQASKFYTQEQERMIELLATLDMAQEDE